jgi:hypothetical protein
MRSILTTKVPTTMSKRIIVNGNDPAWSLRNKLHSFQNETGSCFLCPELDFYTLSLPPCPCPTAIALGEVARRYSVRMVS